MFLLARPDFFVIGEIRKMAQVFSINFLCSKTMSNSKRKEAISLKTNPCLVKFKNSWIFLYQTNKTKCIKFHKKENRGHEKFKI
jgi:hypothetical protein